MADAPFFSSQSSHYDTHRIDQENVPSSPPKPISPLASHARSSKEKKPPTVTPKRFTKFFTPRASLNTRSMRHTSKAGRQLRDITRNGANRTQRKDDMLQHLKEEGLDARPPKRRKTVVDFDDAPQSSPLKHVQAVNDMQILDDEPGSPTVSELDELPELLEDFHPFPAPIRRLRPSNSSRRVLERSFGAYSTSTRSTIPCVPWQSSTADFVSTPTDIHSFRPGTALPFCTAPCHTNSLVALGDEEGSIRLVDTSPAADFTTAHVNFRVHRNAIMDLAFSSSDHLLVTASGDQTSRIVDMHTQTVLCVLSGHSSSVKNVRFKPNDDNVLTTSSRDGSVQIWDLRCSERGSMAAFRIGQRKGLNEDGLAEPSIRYPRYGLRVGPAHRSTRGLGVKGQSTQNYSEDSAVSITAIEHLPNGREHLLLTASELSASVKLWDLRNAGRRDPVPLASTPLPQSHRRTRNYGVSSMVLSGDGARLYTLCKDATVYAYSTNHLLLGHAPEMVASTSRRRTLKEPNEALGPLYGFRHPGLTTGSFYVKMALRPASSSSGGEVLAVGSGTGAPVLFPTDERYHQRSAPELDTEDDDDSLPVAPALAGPREACLPIHERGTPLIRGHNKEVTSLCWSHDGGALVTVSDDFSARCWREDAAKAREMRGCGEGGGRRWGHGWAKVDEGWDTEDC